MEFVNKFVALTFFPSFKGHKNIYTSKIQKQNIQAQQKKLPITKQKKKKKTLNDYAVTKARGWNSRT